MTILQESFGLTNEDLRKIRFMRPGRPLDLQLTTATTVKRVRTEFVGMDGTRCMIFRYPDEGKWGSLGDGIFKDKAVVARYILEDDTGEIIAFKVKVILVAVLVSPNTSFTFQAIISLVPSSIIYLATTASSFNILSPIHISLPSSVYP